MISLPTFPVGVEPETGALVVLLALLLYGGKGLIDVGLRLLQRTLKLNGYSESHTEDEEPADG